MSVMFRNFAKQHYVECGANRLRRQLSELTPCTIKAKFHYASWFETGRRQVRSLSATSFEPASVMEFGFKHAVGDCSTICNPRSLLSA